MYTYLEIFSSNWKFIYSAASCGAEMNKVIKVRRKLDFEVGEF